MAGKISSFLARPAGFVETWGMILGVGIDLVEVARIEASVRQSGEKFLQRILLPGEIAYCLAYKTPGPHLAARFAAKEAVAKAFGTGIGGALGWLDMEVVRQESGEPRLVLHGKGKKLFAERGAKNLLISLSHTDNYATAMAVLEGSSQPT